MSKLVCIQNSCIFIQKYNEKSIQGKSCNELGNLTKACISEYATLLDVYKYMRCNISVIK